MQLIAKLVLRLQKLKLSRMQLQLLKLHLIQLLLIAKPLLHLVTKLELLPKQKP